MLLVTVRGFPSVRAWATLVLALLTSLQIVPLDTPIFVPACSCDKPSRSTSLRASSSAGSIVIVTAVVVGSGMNFVIFAGLGMVTGFGNLPLLPRLRLRPHDIIINQFSYP
jgi:hypothetical protein